MHKTSYILILLFAMSLTSPYPTYAADQIDELFNDEDEIDRLLEDTTIASDITAPTALPIEPELTQRGKDARILFDNLPFKGSYFNYDHENTQIYDAVINNLSETPIEKPIEKPEEIVEAPEVEESVNYTLNSIMYYDATNWSIWINNERIRANEHKSTIIVDQINSKYAILIIQDPEFDMSNIDFTLDFTPYTVDKSENTPYNWTLKSNNNAIFVDQANGIVKFKLEMNQTFNMTELKHFEGKISYNDNEKKIGTTPESLKEEASSKRKNIEKTPTEFDF